MIIDKMTAPGTLFGEGRVARRDCGKGSFVPNVIPHVHGRGVSRSGERRVG